jgi:hypothetical protein
MFKLTAITKTAHHAQSRFAHAVRVAQKGEVGQIRT